MYKGLWVKYTPVFHITFSLLEGFLFRFLMSLVTFSSFSSGLVPYKEWRPYRSECHRQVLKSEQYLVVEKTQEVKEERLTSLLLTTSLVTHYRTLVSET